MSTVSVGTIQSNTSNPVIFTNSSSTEIGTLCRAFCNFNGTGTVAIRASFNVSSITDNGTGDYTVNFTNALPDANYSVNVNSSNAASLGNLVTGCTLNVATANASRTAPTTAAVRFIVYAGGSFVLADLEYVNVAIFR